MLLLDISPSLSLYFLPSSLDLMTLISTLPLSPLDIKHMLQTESQPSLCLHLLLLLTKHFFRKITTKLCSLVLIDSHAVMISGLHWVFHTTCPEPVSLCHSPSTPSLHPPIQGLALNLFLPSQEMTMSLSQALSRSNGTICPQCSVPFTKTLICTHSITCLTSSHFYGNSIPPFLKILVYF